MGNFAKGLLLAAFVAVFFVTTSEWWFTEPETLDARIVPERVCYKYMELVEDLTGWDATGECPTIRVEATNAWFIEGPCNGRKPCNVVGAVDPRKPNLIHVRDTQNVFNKYPPRVQLILWRSVVLHEMVHVMQLRRGLAPRTRALCRMMELQAYAVQAKFLRRFGIRLNIPRNVGC